MSADEHAIGFQVLSRGTPVESSDGTVVGSVHRTSADERTHIFDGIVIKTDGGRRFVDAPEVERITNRRVILTIDAAAVDALPEDKGMLGALEHRAKRSASRWKRRLPGG